MEVSIQRKRPFFERANEYFEDLEEWMEHFGRELSERPSWDLRLRAMEPLHEMRITSTEVLITVDLPSAEKSKIKITLIDDDTLEITAQMKRKVCLDEFGITHYKGEFHEFRYQTHIPVPVDMDKIKTQFKKGMLSVRLPRLHKR